MTAFLLTLMLSLPNGSPLDLAFLAQSKSFFSDFPEIARIFWSKRLFGPCGSQTQQDGFLVPCSTIPATPREYAYPSGQFTIYQNLTYQPPLPSRTQGSLSVAYHLRFVSLGVIWDFLIDARGISETLFLVQYQKVDGSLQIAPGLSIRVKNLRPQNVVQVNQSPTGNFTFRKHKMLDWTMPAAFFNQSMFADLGTRQKCGCPVREMKSLPAETVNALMSLVDDAGEVLPGDKSVFYYAELGFRGCGEVPYLSWFRHMTHRDPEFPIKHDNGIPVMWLKLGEPRDPANYAHDVVEGHGHTETVKQALVDDGVIGPALEDPMMAEALGDLSESEMLDRNLTSAEVGEMVFTLVNLIEGNGLTELQPLVDEFLTNVLADPNHHDDTTIHFNPFEDGELPLFPASFYSDEPPANVQIREQIKAHPLTPFTLGRMLFHEDFWESYDHQKLYEKGMLRARQLEGRNLNQRLRANQLAQAAWQNQPGVLAATQEDLESEPALNGNQEDIVYQVPMYDRCHDPSQVAIERLAFGEIANILTEGDCGLLIRITQ